MLAEGLIMERVERSIINGVTQSSFSEWTKIKAPFEVIQKLWWWMLFRLTLALYSVVLQSQWGIKDVTYDFKLFKGALICWTKPIYQLSLRIWNWKISFLPFFLRKEGLFNCKTALNKKHNHTSKEKFLLHKTVTNAEINVIICSFRTFCDTSLCQIKGLGLGWVGSQLFLVGEFP